MFREKKKKKLVGFHLFWMHFQKGEAFGLLQAMLWLIIDWGFQSITFETDCKLLADNINRGTVENYTECGILIDHIREIFAV